MTVFLRSIVGLALVVLSPTVLGLDLQPAAHLESAVRGAGAEGTEWLIYAIDSERTDRFVCCAGWKDGEVEQQACRPEADRGSLWITGATSGARPPGPAANRLRVHLAVKNGEIQRVHAYSAGCRVETSWPVRELAGVSQEQSLEVLHRFVASSAAEDHRGDALAAIASHLAPGAIRTLESLSEPDHDAELREQALFWIGQTGSPRAVEVLSTRFADEPDDPLREKILFSLSQTGFPEAARQIERAARHDRSAEVRRHAWFCLALTGSPGAEEALFEALRDEGDREVRDGAVFALSQLPERRGVEALLRVLRTSSDREVQRQALFWLAESGDPAALEHVAELLN